MAASTSGTIGLNERLLVTCPARGLGGLLRTEHPGHRAHERDGADKRGPCRRVTYFLAGAGAAAGAGANPARTAFRIGLIVFKYA